MFGLGMMEIGLIIALAVMLFPPKELPKVARAIARLYGQVRKTADDFRHAVLQDEDLRAPIDEIKGVYEEARGEIRDAERKARQQLAKAQMEMRMATARRIQVEREAKAAEEAKARALGLEPQAETPTNSDVPDPEQAANLAPPLDEPDPFHEIPVAAADPRSLSASTPPGRELPSRSGSRPELSEPTPPGRELNPVGPRAVANGPELSEST